MGRVVGNQMRGSIEFINNYLHIYIFNDVQNAGLCCGGCEKLKWRNPFVEVVKCEAGFR